MGYLEELLDTFKEQPFNMFCTAFLIWIISPIIIFGVWGIILIASYSSLDMEIFTNLFINAIIPWWASIFINFKKFVLGYLSSLILTTILVNHDILETINFKELLQKLKQKT